MKAKLKKLANRIAELEKECQAGNNVNENMITMEKLVADLSADEILIIDEYISENHLLTK